MRRIGLVGSAFGHGAQIITTNMGPLYLKEKFNIMEKLHQMNIQSFWHETIKPKINDLSDLPNKGRCFNAVLEHNSLLYESIKDFIKKYSHDLPLVLGGDHSCAIGTWSGVIEAHNAFNKFGLIWIDAHLDAHRYETSPSKAYHGMPLAVLLGCGDPELLNIGSKPIKIDPQHVVLIGARSYEREEEELLISKGVKIFSAEETNHRGIAKVFKEALSIVNHNTNGFGVSFDLDAIDPQEAPGVGSPEKNGLSWNTLKANLKMLFEHPKFKALEITEFNPCLDINNMTAEIAFQTINELGVSLRLIEEKSKQELTLA